jgi:pyruvate ferredoxin oxidoreductase alpha subunit
MYSRDTGWIQLWSENAQEAYDNAIMAYRIAEHKDIRLPIMVNMDGFIISHSIETMEYLEDAQVKKFVGKFERVNPLLDLENPKSFGPLILTDYYHEYKRLQHEIMGRVKDVVISVTDEYAKLSGRQYGLFDSYRMEDAEVGIVVLGSAAGTTKDVIDEYRGKGIKAGLIRPRLFRPFPFDEVADALKHLKAVAVLDRADSFGSYGPVFMEVSSALYQNGGQPKMINKIYGLGGRDYMPSQAAEVIEELNDIAQGGSIKLIKDYLGVRG